MDIRNFFGPATSSRGKLSLNKKHDTKTETKQVKKLIAHKKRGARIMMLSDSDDDEEPLPKSARSSTATAALRKSNGIVSDSEEELKVVKKRATPPPTKSKSPKKLKMITVDDFFSDAPISQCKRKMFVEKTPNCVTEVDIHDDEDFGNVLDQVDKKDTEKNAAIPDSEKLKSRALLTRNLFETSSAKSSLKVGNEKDTTPTKDSPRKDDKKSRTTATVCKDEENKTPPKVAKLQESPAERVIKSPVESNPFTVIKKQKSPAKPAKSPIKFIDEGKNKTSPLRGNHVESEKPAQKQDETTKSLGNEDEGLSSGDKRRLNYLKYRSYLQREGPAAPGSKEIPEGEEGCLQGLTFLLTGVMDSLERDEAKELIQKYSGKVMTTLSKNTTYLVLGRDAGTSKLAKAEKLGTKQIDEDGLLDLIKTRPGNKIKKALTTPTRGKSSSSAIKPSPLKKAETWPSPKKERELPDETEKAVTDTSPPTKERKKLFPADFTSPAEPAKSNPLKTVETSVCKTPVAVGELMLVDKYKPSSVKQLIGQHGDKSNAKKLIHWLINWHKNHCNGRKHPPPKWGAQDDGSSRKAALLSGSPGVGKTTTAQLVCKELGFNFIEMNASDTRSKKNLQEHVQELLSNQTLTGFVSGEGKQISSKHVIIMDEVDGMSGNQDRGGTQELIALIKSSRIPVICICNDRAHPKIRSLSNYCFDLRFQRPRAEQIKAAMMSVAFKEKLKISPTTLQEIIVASNQDVRQVLHNMSLWTAKDKALTGEQVKEDTKRATKDIKLGPFDVLKKVFSAGQESAGMTIHDKSDLFFHDYSLAPLFVQENYLDVKPISSRGNIKEHLKLLSQAADSICDGDLVDHIIRTTQNWSLLPTQAMYASVIPGDVMRGYLSQMIRFPSWLGKNSSRNHMDRVLQELQMHMRLRISGNKSELNLDYMSSLRDALTKPLVKQEQEGVPEVLRVLESYFLLKEDMDTVLELSLWPGQKNPLANVNPKVKASLTRAYNKEGIKNPYSTATVKKDRANKKSSNDFGGEEEEGMGAEENVDEDSEQEEDLALDAMVKQKKVAKKTASSQPSTSTSARGSRGGGRGKRKK